MNAKGLVTGGGALLAADIPILDWSKIGGGKPTTLAGYGITDGAPLNSPVFTGNPTAPTPAQFDNDASLANTAFVQRALGSFSASGARAGNYALSAADAGSLIVAGSSAGPLTYTMPAITDVPLGTCFTVVNLTGHRITLAPNGTEKFIGNLDRSGSASSYVVENGDTFTVTKYQGGLWLVSSVGGTMLASLAGNGYQRLASGLILQWGTTANITAGSSVALTYPMTFPNGVLNVMASAHGSAVSSTACQLATASGTASGTTIYNWSTGRDAPARWMAIGY
ncbi:hypothetical protein FQZ97_923560 [compost metagenome]